MKKTIDLTNVYRLRRNLHQAMLEMRLDDALALTKELESAAEKACYEITELDHICVPTTWDAFLKVLEERNGTAPSAIPNRWLGESEVYGAEILRGVRSGSTEERFNGVMAQHYGLTKLKGVVQTGVPENEMPTDIHGKPADITMDKLAIIPKRPDFGIPSMGSYMTPTKPAPHNVRYETNQSAMDKINAEKDRTEAFINIVPQELAVRMINDLRHLCSISDDINYVTALCNEMRRLSLFANGEVKSLNDINFAWIYRK